MNPDNRRLASPASRPVTLETAWNVHRFASLVLSVWIGGILVIAITAPLSFHAVDALMASQPGILKAAVAKVGPVPMYEVLRLHAGEVNRLMFQTFGYIQMALALVVFVQVVFFSSLKKMGVLLSTVMLAVSVSMVTLLIPAIVHSGREIQSSVAARASGEERFRALHIAFTSFEIAVALVGGLLLLLLLQRSRLTSRVNAPGN